MATLGIKTDGIITEFVRAKTKPESNAATMSADLRGKTPNPRKLDDEVIRAHIMSFQPQVTHYTLENAPNHRYLEPHLTITDMWKHYNSEHDPISYIAYQRIFQSMNIGFGKPSQDDCDTCESFNNHGKEENHDKENCEKCNVLKLHLERAKKARKFYLKDHQDIPDNFSIFTADMQKVVLLRKMTIKEHFFVSRLVVFNESFASVKEDCDYTILWHEGISGRKATDVASAFVKCINTSGKDHVIFLGRQLQCAK